MGSVVNINDVLDGHVGLEVECVDRLYLNAYVPTLQVPGQVFRFLHDHLGFMLASPAIFEKIGNRFRGAVRCFAEDNDIPVLRLKKPDRTHGMTASSTTSARICVLRRMRAGSVSSRS